MKIYICPHPAMQGGHKKTKAKFSCFLRHLAWKRRGPFLVLAFHKSVAYLLRHPLSYSPTTHTRQRTRPACHGGCSQCGQYSDTVSWVITMAAHLQNPSPIIPQRLFQNDYRKNTEEATRQSRLIEKMANKTASVQSCWHRDTIRLSSTLRRTASAAYTSVLT